VVAPIERWLGTLRTIGVFAAGHILSTLIVAVVLQHDLVALAGNDASRRSIDVGVSYGFFCLAAMFTYRLRGRWIWPWLWAAAITLDVIIPYALDRTFTGFGHLAAVAIGFALYPLSRRATARQRLAWPIWKPPAATVAAALASIEARRRARHPRLEALESGEPDDSVSGAGPAGP
jgi:hypothetical protein